MRPPSSAPHPLRAGTLVILAALFAAAPIEAVAGPRPEPAVTKAYGCSVKY
jgi:hypothetical protein